LELLVEFGDAFYNLHPDAALSAYNKVITEIENGSYSHPEDKENENRLYLLLTRACYGIRRIDWRAEKPPVPYSSFPDRGGNVIFLRPLLSTGHLTITNGFRPDPSWDPPLSSPGSRQITLEAALHRALTRHVVFISLGGRPDGYGAGRLMLLGTGDEDSWKKLVEAMIGVADVVVLVPNASEGIAWEIDLLIRQQLLPKTVFVMPPGATDLNVPDLWIETATMMADRGIRLPDYDPNGLFFQLGPDGQVTYRWPFETVWMGTLIDNLNHLLPDHRPDSAGQRRQVSSPIHLDDINQ
jgi:hypothetical protein